MALAQREHGETIVAGPGHDGGFTVTWALAVLRRHARLATVVFSVVLAGAATFAMSLPDVYRSTATVLVEHPGTTEGVGKSLIAGELETRLQTIGQEVLSQARLTALMDRFDLYPELRAHGAHAAAVERLRRDIQVKLTKAEPGAGRPTTVAFSIMFRWRHPETVARVANALAAFYVEENGKIRERQASAARLTRLTQELAQMQEVYTSQYPDVIRLSACPGRPLRWGKNSASWIPQAPLGARPRRSASDSSCSGSVSASARRWRRCSSPISSTDRSTRSRSSGRSRTCPSWRAFPASASPARTGSRAG